MDTAGMKILYGKKKNEVSDMIAYFELKYPGIKVKKR